MHTSTCAHISPTKFITYVDSGYSVSVTGCPWLGQLPVWPAAHGRGWGFYGARRGRAARRRGGRGEEADIEMVCLCVCGWERERERKQAPKAWHGFERHSGGSVLHPYNADIAPTQPLHTHTHVYGGKPTLISCYYAPLKQLSVQSQMRGWHRWGNISRGLKAAQRIWTCSGV